MLAGSSEAGAQGSSSAVELLDNGTITSSVGALDEESYKTTRSH